MKTLAISAAAVILLIQATTVFAQQTGTEAGISLYRESRFDECAVVLRDIVANDAKDKLAWLYLGAALARSGKSKEAIKAFRKSNYTYKDGAVGVDTPAEMTNRPFPAYTDQARMYSQSGTVKVAVGLEADGTLGFILPFQILPWGLTENAVAAAKELRFRPAIKDGKPVSTVTVVSYSFDIH